MRKLLILALALVLAACGSATEPVSNLTPPAASTQLEVTVIQEQATVMSAVTEPATQAPSDPFAANFLQLPAPSCSSPTPQQTEGPYYKAGSPERKILKETGMAGELLLVAGYVLDQDCQPIAHAWLDFWQADSKGVYDNSGYIFRGHQFTDEQGRYFLETVVPGEYPGRTEHIHVKIQPPNGSIITTQLYFPGVSANTGDGIFDPALLVALEAREGLYVAYFNFVVAK